MVVPLGVHLDHGAKMPIGTLQPDDEGGKGCVKMGLCRKKRHPPGEDITRWHQSVLQTESSRRANPVKPLRTLGQSALAALLCLSLALWSIFPAASHASVVFEAPQEHANLMGDHGHSHRKAEDFQRLLHGHGHDAADYDHSEALQAPAEGRNVVFGFGDVRARPPSYAGPSRILRIERPPRV